MAVDYIIGALQLLSAAVNVLALGSFWITPGLRTTANRFVINLLVVNIVGCLALTPALWLHGGLIPTVYNEIRPIYDNDETLTSTVAVPMSSLPDDFDDFSSTIDPTIFFEIFATKQIYQQNGISDVEIIADIREDEQQNRSNTVSPDQTWSPTKNVQYSDCTRFWGFDLVAALGKLALICCLLFSK